MTQTRELILHVIDGREVTSRDEATFENINPWTQEPRARVALGGGPEAAAAVAAARRAFDEGPWPRLGFAERGRILYRLADLIESNAGRLAEADSLDMGKPISVAASADVPRSAANFRFFADHARLSAAEVLPSDSGHHTYTAFPPAGVVVAISPWNFPLMLESWKVAPALAWGNSVVLKPAEDTPASAHLLGLLALEAGLPPGVLNVVQGMGAGGVGQFLTESAQVDRITFTGESGTGRAISRAASSNLIPLSLELGGKGANIVFADADLGNAVSWAARAAFSNSGQVCLAGSRLYVQREVFDPFVECLVEAAAAMRLGDPGDPSTELGPLASREHFAKVSGYLDVIADEGAKLCTGGLGEGWLVRPSVVVDAPAQGRLCREEIFGPVVTVEPFDDEADVVARANDTPYGLNAMIFTSELSRAHRVASRLRAGTVWVNCFFVRDLRAPFGGVGDSGVGREGGNFSREFFTEPKAVVMQITTAP